jgi:hypothetical protein
MLVVWSRKNRRRKREKPPLSLPEGRSVMCFIMYDV